MNVHVGRNFTLTPGQSQSKSVYKVNNTIFKFKEHCCYKLQVTNYRLTTDLVRNIQKAKMHTSVCPASANENKFPDFYTYAPSF